VPVIVPRSPWASREILPIDARILIVRKRIVAPQKIALQTKASAVPSPKQTD
jgi:hypothetical protein